MKYFRRIRSAIDPAPFLNEIAAIDGAWDQSTGRQAKIKVQRGSARHTAAWFAQISHCRTQAQRRPESRWTTGSVSYPIACQFLRDVAQTEKSLLSRAKIVCLPAGRRVYPHIDRGEYYAVRNRYHFVLKSSRGSWLKSGDEEIRMREGELWWFDNKEVHEAYNDGDQDRIHMIFDLLPRADAERVFGDAA